jgi:hypothetical protein
VITLEWWKQAALEEEEVCVINVALTPPAGTSLLYYTTR